MANYIQVITTVDKKEEAETIARILLEKRLAACVQVIGPGMSFFWWKGEIDRAEEYICFIKSRQDLYDRLETAIKAVHPYDIPEILVTPILGGGPDYLKWLETELHPAE